MSQNTACGIYGCFLASDELNKDSLEERSWSLRCVWVCDGVLCGVCVLEGNLTRWWNPAGGGVQVFAISPLGGEAEATLRWTIHISSLCLMGEQNATTMERKLERREILHSAAT